MRKLLILSLCTVSFLLAQETNKPLVSVSFFRVHPTKASQWLGAVKSILAPAMDKLVAEGTIIAYGVDENLFHDPESSNYDLWYSVKDFGALSKSITAIDDVMEKNAAAIGPAMEAQDFSAHADILFRTVEAKSTMPKPGQMPFTVVSTFRAKPGKGGEMVQAFKSFYQPVYDKLVEDGSLFGYFLLDSVTHRNNIGEYTMVVEMPDLGAMDKIEAAFGAMMKGKSEEEKNMIESMFEAVSESDGHRDWILKAVMYKAGS